MKFSGNRNWVFCSAWQRAQNVFDTCMDSWQLPGLLHISPSMNAIFLSPFWAQKLPFHVSDVTNDATNGVSPSVTTIPFCRSFHTHPINLPAHFGRFVQTFSSWKANLKLKKSRRRRWPEGLCVFRKIGEWKSCISILFYSICLQ